MTIEVKDVVGLDWTRLESTGLDWTRLDSRDATGAAPPT